MLDDSILEKFIHSFFGYGSYEADTWFVGMKEWGGDKGKKMNILSRLGILSRGGNVGK